MTSPRSRVLPSARKHRPAFGAKHRPAFSAKHRPAFRPVARGLALALVGKSRKDDQMDISITEEPSRLAAVVRRVVPAAEIRSYFDSVYSDVAAALRAAGLAPAGPALSWLHLDTPADHFDVAAGFPVEGVAIGTVSGEVEVVTISGGPAVVAELVGDYEELPAAWQAVDNFREAEGLEPRGDALELYLTMPTPESDPAENRTHLAMYLR